MIRVGIVDDSPSIRSALRELINREADMICVGSATDPFAAREMIKVARPDVLTLDIEMPRMNGLEFLERLMRLHPMPVLMISSLTERGSKAALDALSLGAVDVISKPNLQSQEAWDQYALHIIERIRVAALARIPARKPETPTAGSLPVTPPPNSQTSPRISPASGRPLGAHDPVVLIGASTGGTEALRALLGALPANFPPTLVVQHMPPAFTRHFAERLDQHSALRVREAEHGDVLEWGSVMVAPGHSHLRMENRAGQWRCALDQSDKRNHHRPSVDVLYESALTLGARVHAVLLTGMGRDGAQAMLSLHAAGAHTVCQSEASCLVFGMPRAAIALGAASEVMDLERIPAYLSNKLRPAA